jgi:hypothetical protein
VSNNTIERWVCAIALAVSCSIGSACEQSLAPTAPSSVTPTAGNGARTPPVIVSLTLSATEAIEVDRDVTVRAEIVDADTTVDKLVLLWSATAGQITGNGPTVTWRLPRSTAPTPLDVTISLTVVEAFQAPGADGRIEPREFRVSRDAAPIRAHDSVAEISEMALKYLVNRYGDTLMTPAQCLANFSDACAGKDEELSEITAGRRQYENLYAEAYVGRVTYDRVRRSGDIVAPCTFTSREIATGRVATTVGDCYVTAVYEQRRWWLCTSTLRDARTTPDARRGGDDE